MMAVKECNSNSIFPSPFISWDYTIRKSSYLSPIYLLTYPFILFICVSVSSWILILFHELCYYHFFGFQIDPGWGLRIFISRKFQDDANAAGPKSILRGKLSRMNLTSSITDFATSSYVTEQGS